MADSVCVEEWTSVVFIGVVSGVSPYDAFSDLRVIMRVLSDLG